MKKRQMLLSEEQWELVGPMLPRPGDGRTIGADPGHRTGGVSRAFCGFCRPAQRGGSCRTRFLRPRPAGGGSSSGKRKAFGCMRGELCWGHWMKKVC